MSVEVIIGLVVITAIVIFLMSSLRQKNPSSGSHVRGIPEEPQSGVLSAAVPQFPSSAVPAAPSAAKISPDEFGMTFFSGMLDEEEAAAEFEKLRGKTVVWNGVVRNAFQYNSDLDFGAGPGLRLLIDIGEVPDEYGAPQSVSAVASFSTEYSGNTKELRGREIRFKGTLLKIGIRTRNVYLSHAE